MTKPYSEDLRTRVVAAVVAGASCRKAAKRFSIGVSSVVRWARRFRQTGSVAAKPMGGERAPKMSAELVLWSFGRGGRVPRLAHRRVILLFCPMRALSWNQISIGLARPSFAAISSTRSPWFYGMATRSASWVIVAGD